MLPVACSADSSSATSNSKTSNSKASDTVTMSDQWIKAADSGMSATFGTLQNSGDQPVQLVAATSPASATVEIHEVVSDTPGGDKTMRPKAGGLTIPAHGKATLAPGADHLMFIDLKQPLRTGASTPLTLTFSDGSTITVTAQVRDFAGGKEKYEPAPENSAHGG
ncbi:copper chaperone PCu(A)C [Nocardia jejuensis]|uniref:copper chaperone PCu(A)C n=1 Tax=Nocardia jejuensis TaxID=328049 RepID=UPI0008357535|nr:copper chaperone PCu(A)C [Nocardia jejuensis]